MAYTQFIEDKPVLSDPGADVVSVSRTNLMALRDAVVSGALPGWILLASGTTDTPPFIAYEKGTERVRLSITWGTTGGATGNPTGILYSYSSNGGSTYEAMGTLSLTYHTTGTLLSTTWT